MSSCICFKLWLVHWIAFVLCDWPEWLLWVWFYNIQLKTALKHYEKFLSTQPHSSVWKTVYFMSFSVKDGIHKSLHAVMPAMSARLTCISLHEPGNTFPLTKIPTFFIILKARRTVELNVLKVFSHPRHRLDTFPAQNQGGASYSSGKTLTQ